MEFLMKTFFCVIFALVFEVVFWSEQQSCGYNFVGPFQLIVQNCKEMLEMSTRHLVTRCRPFGAGRWIPTLVAIIWCTALSANGVNVICLWTALGPCGVVAPKVLLFVVFTGKGLFTAHLDLFHFSTTLTDFEVTWLLKN